MFSSFFFVYGLSCPILEAGLVIILLQLAWGHVNHSYTYNTSNSCYTVLCFLLGLLTGVLSGTSIFSAILSTLPSPSHFYISEPLKPFLSNSPVPLPNHHSELLPHWTECPYTSAMFGHISLEYPLFFQLLARFQHCTI